MSENTSLEGLDLTVSFTMGADAFQREKEFESLSLKGDVVLGNDFRLVAAYKELVLGFIKLSTYRRLKEALTLEDKTNVTKLDGTKTKSLDEANEVGFERRRNGLAASIGRVEDTLEILTKELDNTEDIRLIKKSEDLLDYIMSEFFSDMAV